MFVCYDKEVQNASSSKKQNFMSIQNDHYIIYSHYMLLGQDFYTGFMQNCRSKKQPESHFKVKQILLKTWKTFMPK